jgi:hypothetical protein
MLQLHQTLWRLNLPALLAVIAVIAFYRVACGVVMAQLAVKCL